MSHIVIHEDKNGATQYCRFDELQAAAEYLEHLANSDDASGAHLYRLDEVEFEVKSYIKVEIAHLPVAEREEVTRIPASEPEILPTAEDLEDIEYVEAAMGPIETMEATPIPEYANDSTEDALAGGQGEARRGLFGR